MSFANIILLAKERIYNNVKIYKNSISYGANVCIKKIKGFTEASKTEICRKLIKQK